jgi:hypothetical protein
MGSGEREASFSLPLLLATRALPPLANVNPAIPSFWCVFQTASLAPAQTPKTQVLWNLALTGGSLPQEPAAPPARAC